MKKLFAFSFLLFTLSGYLSTSASDITNYQPLDKKNPVQFYGNSIIYQRQKIELNEKTFFVDGQLPETISAEYPFVFHSFNEAVKHLTDGTSTQPMTVYIAPYVYWIDDPDDSGIRMPQEGSHTPIGLHVKCNHLKIIGLTDNPCNVSLACNRGQSLGSKGNFTLFSFEGDNLNIENLTIANYCNVDLDFPLKPALNRPKRSSTIVQAQLAFCNGDRIEAHNVRFISRLNTCNLIGGKRTLFDRCHVECTDDALATGVYLNCTFDFYSSKPFGHTSGTGAVMLNCDFNVIDSQKQYFTKRQGPVAVVDSRFYSKNQSLYVGWNQEPTDDFRGYQYNVQLNGKPLIINADKPHITVDMSGKPVLSAYRFQYRGKVIYNTYNLLRGNDDWDPMKIKPVVEKAEQQSRKDLHEIPVFLRPSHTQFSIETGNVSQLHLKSGTYTDKSIEPLNCRWKIIQNQSFIHFSPQGCSAEVTGNNSTDTAKTVILEATNPLGLQAAVVVEVRPEILSAPQWITLPEIRETGNKTLHITYQLALESRADESIITWYRSKNNTQEDAIPVAVSRNGKPESDYSLSQNDAGYYIFAGVQPKHVRSLTGKEVFVHLNKPVSINDVVFRNISTDFSNFPTQNQPEIIPGFWTLDSYRPSESSDDEKWFSPAGGNYWKYDYGYDNAKGIAGLIPTAKGARLLYTPIEKNNGNMRVKLKLAPCKSAGQGFGMAGQYLDIYIQFDAQTQSGYGLRIIRTTKSARAVDFVLMKYENAKATAISEAQTSICFRTTCTVSMEIKNQRFSVHAETDAIANGEYPNQVNLNAEIKNNAFGGTGLHFTGTAASNSTVVREMQIEWTDLSATAQNAYNALPWSNSLAYNSYLMRTVHSQYRERNEELNKAFISKAAMQAYIDDCRKRYRSIAGEFPAKSELNAQVVSVFEYPGLRVENIIFESLPGRFVTANFYLPVHRTGKIPAAIQLCGHGINGKVSESPIGALLALNGIAVLVVDPIGQGERLQLIDKKGNALTRGATTEHTLLNAGLNLLGTSLAAQEYWDNHRALDYLLTRSEIDGGKIGAFGSSGGGTQTAYFIGLDDRIKVSAICSFFSQRERTLELQGASDGCQHIPHEGREQLELTDFALMAAPKPVLILSGKYDFVDLQGAQQGFAQLKKAYDVLGIPERADMLTVETGHGLSFEKQQRLIRWFRQWLTGKADVIASALPERIDVDKLYCTPTHQVNTAFPQAQSILDENLQKAGALERQRRAFQAQDKSVVKAKIEELLGLSANVPLQIVPGPSAAGRDYKQYKFQLIREGEMPIPCVVILPDKTTGKSPVRLILQETGKNAFLNEFTNLTGAISAGTILIAADLRGFGETTDPVFYNDAKYRNFEYRNAMISMHVGKPVLGQRVQDILSIVDFCSTQNELKGHPVQIQANGLYGPAVIHAAFLDDRITSADISRSIRSWTTYLANPLQYDMYSNVLYGVLNYYDLPDLARLSGKSVRFSD